MNFLLTTGSTLAPIDPSRAIVVRPSTKIGAQLVQLAFARGHSITCLTSEPETFANLQQESDRKLNLIPFSTFDDFSLTMQNQVKDHQFDCVFHAAAVGEYLSAGVYTPEAGTSFNARTRLWEGRGGKPAMKEHIPNPNEAPDGEVWVRMARAPKLVDRIRSQWAYKGMLVEFKTVSNVTDTELVDLAEKSRLKSQADLIVVNTWESANLWSCLGPLDGNYERVPRRELAERLILSLEHIARQARSKAEFQLRAPTDHDTHH